MLDFSFFNCMWSLKFDYFCLLLVIASHYNSYGDLFYSFLCQE